MLTPSTATVVFNTTFTQTITVSTSETVEGVDPETGEPTSEVITTPSTTVPVVIASFTDPGVTITTAPGSVTLSGKYTSILPVTWKWLDLNNVQQTGKEPPADGEYNKIFQMDSPSNLTEDCTYTIDGESFVHTVTLVTYDTLRDTMLAKIAGSK